MISMFLLSLVVNVIIKLIVWLVKANMDGEHISERKLNKINELLWVCERLKPEAVRAGCVAGGVQPADWDAQMTLGDDE